MPKKTQGIFSPVQTATLDESLAPAIRLPPTPVIFLFFFFKWVPWLVLAMYPHCHAAISAHASRSRMAALRGAL